jgi:ubiquinone/menaquinone biosynthesis C-methylase UbiE
MTAPKNVLTRFSDRVAEYVKYRPGYPAEIIDTLRSRCGLTQQSVIADIGSGPGNLARLCCENGNEIFAVEPNAEMRTAGLQLLGGYAGYRSVEGTAEQTGLPDASVDFVTAAQAFHWFQWPLARLEFQRILRPAGWVVLIWNERQTESTAFLRDYEALLLEYGTDYKEVRHENSYANITEFFDAPYQQARFENHQIVDLDGLRGRLLSSSYIPASDHPRREPMLHDLRRVFERHQRDGKVDLEYAVRMYFGQLA